MSRTPDLSSISKQVDEVIKGLNQVKHDVLWLNGSKAKSVQARGTAGRVVLSARVLKSLVDEAARKSTGD